MTPDERWEFLLQASKRVSKAFEEGRNPSFWALDKLKCAIAGAEAVGICGHRFIDGPCDCAKYEEPIK